MTAAVTVPTERCVRGAAPTRLPIGGRWSAGTDPATVANPVVKLGAPTIARLMGVTLARDHRILYGAAGAELLARVRALLEEPVGLAL